MTDPLPAQDLWIDAAGLRLEARTLGAPADHELALVFLHEGLGCVAMWRQFPALLCAALKLPGLLYSRAGYGGSQAADLPRTPEFMHHEARVVLPQVLQAAGIRRAILVGHSDGGSIALLHAATGAPQVVASIVMAPHLFVEPITVASIRAISDRFEAGGLRQRLARYHADPVATFRGWADAWLDPVFAAWNIEEEVSRIATPVLALQGRQDEYGTLSQIQRLAALAPHARWVGLDDCGHSPFVDQPQRVIDECLTFVAPLMSGRHTPP
jgi:pimeloyl-ACP methyl ester carboxylesterase